MPGRKARELPAFEMPRPDAGKAELVRAITAEAARYRAQLQAIYDFVTSQYEDGPLCYEGTTEFLESFPELPDDVEDDEWPEDEEITDPAYFTAAGLRHILEDRIAAHAGTLSKMRQYGIDNRGNFDSIADLNEGLEAAGLEPYTISYSVRVTAEAAWDVPGEINGEDAIRQYRHDISVKIDEAVRQVMGDAHQVMAPRVRTSVYEQQ